MVHIPLSLVAPVRLSTDTPNGLFYPFKPVGGVMLFIVWEGQPHLAHLTGERAFAVFRIQAGYPARGALMTDVEFRVDPSSQYDAMRESDPLGSLVLQDGRLSLMAYRAGDGFGDPFDMPLWGEYNAGTPEEKIGYSRWSIIARDGDELVTLWSTDEK